MFLYNARRNRKSKTGPGFFGSEKWIEQAFFDIRRDSFARIANLENHDFTRSIADPFCIEPRSQSNCAVPPNAFRRILDEINQDLFYLLKVDADAGAHRVLIEHFYIGLFQLRRH